MMPLSIKLTSLYHSFRRLSTIIYKDVANLTDILRNVNGRLLLTKRRLQYPGGARPPSPRLRRSARIFSVFFRQKQKDKLAQLPIRKLRSFIRLRRVILLRSDIRLSPSGIRYASFMANKISRKPQAFISLSLATISRRARRGISLFFAKRFFCPACGARNSLLAHSLAEFRPLRLVGLAVSAPGGARPPSPRLRRSARIFSVFFRQKQKDKHSLSFCFWRRRRDSNSRAVIHDLHP